MRWLTYFTSKKNLALYLIASILGNIILLGIVISVKMNSESVYVNPYPLIDPARSVVAKEHFFSTLQPLREELIRIAEGASPNKVGIYFEFLNTGANIAVNHDGRFWPASLTKLPTAFVVMKKVEKGEWKLSNELVLFDEDRDDRFGNLHKRPIGTRFTIEELLKELLINSDNTAHSILVRNLSSQEYTEMLDALGLNELFDKDYNITVKEYSRLFRALYSASYLDRKNSQQLLSWLSDTNFSEFLGAGLPSSELFSHKIGEEENQVVFLDSGIVYVPSRPYLITVMIEVEDGMGREKAKEIMKNISKKSYEYVTSKQKTN